MRILVTGANGQLGNELRRCLVQMKAEIGPVATAYEGATADFIDYAELDISDVVAVNAWFVRHTSYDLVINCAAITNVNGCETDENGALRVNAIGVANLAEMAQNCGAKFVHVSTDYVFPGNQPGERVETDQTGPVSAYGRTKLEGERQALLRCSRTFVVRTAWLYGYVGENFVKTMMRLGKSHEKVTVVDDQMGNPTSANDLAYEILKIALTDEYGIYHCTDKGTCSWADFAQTIMKGAGLSCKVERCTSAEYKTAHSESADRPAYSSLRNKHLEDTVGDDMRPWPVALSEYLQNLSELGD